MKFAAAIHWAVICAASAAWAQSPQSMRFEVASIKRDASQRGVSGGCRGIDTVAGATSGNVPLGRCVILSGRLDHVPGIASQSTSTRIRYADGKEPAWADDRFELEAKAEDPEKTTESQLFAMLRNELEDRFKLQLHHTTEQVSGAQYRTD